MIVRASLNDFHVDKPEHGLSPTSTLLGSKLNGLPSNPIVLAWGFTAAEATALDYSSVDSAHLNHRTHGFKYGW